MAEQGPTVLVQTVSDRPNYESSSPDGNNIELLRSHDDDGDYDEAEDDEMDGISGVLEKQRRMKLTMLIQQLDYFFYILTVVGYYLDGKTLLQIQFCQPNQIQPGRPLRFFTLASLLITSCSSILHLTILLSSNNDNKLIINHGIVIDFIGQVTVIFLLVLDSIGCLTQLLLVLISFCDSNSIPLSSTSNERLADKYQNNSKLFEISLNESISLFFSSTHPSSSNPQQSSSPSSSSSNSANNLILNNPFLVRNNNPVQTDEQINNVYIK
ncbi:hypothetical protein BY996DRAFT_4448797 [Phakopsora pachyrhizi]|nr:hypothetical protein BY996DRAFT_841957 [Phakopsora pachyrhizi]KAI8449744.1 hypothetical protein BY996DRAFT_4448797 [Phakopsora pachyrhizi]